MGHEPFQKHTSTLTGPLIDLVLRVSTGKRVEYPSHGTATVEIDLDSGKTLVVVPNSHLETSPTVAK